VTSPTRAQVAVAGHTGDIAVASQGLTSPDATVRATALGALERIGVLSAAEVMRAFHDPDEVVRHRAARLAADDPTIDLSLLLDDDAPMVVEMAAWACGEHETVSDPVLMRLTALATGHSEPLVREAAVAALGAIGDERGLAAVLAGTTDKPAIRRRAVIALAAFEGPDVDAALARAASDKDWQVRDAAEELLRIDGSAEPDDGPDQP
jgi:HEAT repeat protein